MKAACPQCGADIEFRFDDTFVRVCDHCRAAVVRGDRGLETLGEFADLAETGSPLALFATGSWQGASFQLVGRAQLKHHAGGSWDEWYARFDDGRWGWLAEAQGRFYLLFELTADDYAPPFDSLRAGERAHVPGAAGMTIAEVGEATYVAAAGEIPFKLGPGTTYRYADLSDEAGAFATIDYGDGSGKPTAYLGQSPALADLHIKGGATPAPAGPAIRASRLACPNCDGSIELRAPDATMRVGCPFCGAMLDASEGALSVLAKLDQGKSVEKPEIPLGSKGTFEGTELTLIGWMRRMAMIDGTAYPFEEHLLYAPALGFRWLVLSDGAWSYAQPVDVGQVGDNVGGTVRYDGVKFRHFQSAPLFVDRVIGEMYWKVEVGEKVDSEDFVAPPAMLSKEAGGGEINWSLSTWMSQEAVERAFEGLHLTGSAIGVAPNMPPRLHGFWPIYGAAILALAIGACIVTAGSSSTHVTSLTCDQASTPPPSSDPSYTAPPNSAVCFSEPFQLDGSSNIAVELVGNVANSWISVGGDLVNDETGDVESFDRDIEYYFGVDDGESWHEGSNDETVFLDPMPEGRYVLRVELQSSSLQYQVEVSVDQGVFHLASWVWLAAFVLGPGLLLGLLWYVNERSRWQNSDNPPPLMGKSDD